MANLNQVYHDRARESSVELRKLTVSLSTGAIAVFFLVLTKEVKPPLTLFQQQLLFFTVCSFGFSIFGGILSWWAYGSRFYFMALINDKSDLMTSSDIKCAKRWSFIRRISDIIVIFSFSSGIFISFIFLFDRIKQ